MSEGVRQLLAKLTCCTRCTWSIRFTPLYSLVVAPLGLMRQVALCAISRNIRLALMLGWREFLLFQLPLFSISASALLLFVLMRLQAIAPVSRQCPVLWRREILARERGQRW